MEDYRQHEHMEEDERREYRLSSNQPSPQNRCGARFGHSGAKVLTCGLSRPNAPNAVLAKLLDIVDIGGG